jgi:hypothetical protein
VRALCGCPQPHLLLTTRLAALAQAGQAAAEVPSSQSGAAPPQDRPDSNAEAGEPRPAHALPVAVPLPALPPAQPPSGRPPGDDADAGQSEQIAQAQRSEHRQSGSGSDADAGLPEGGEGAWGYEERASPTTLQVGEKEGQAGATGDGSGGSNDSAVAGEGGHLSARATQSAPAPLHLDAIEIDGDMATTAIPKGDHDHSESRSSTQSSCPSPLSDLESHQMLSIEQRLLRASENASPPATSAVLGSGAAEEGRVSIVSDADGATAAPPDAVAGTATPPRPPRRAARVVGQVK